jgi:hypothetical protein
MAGRLSLVIINASRDLSTFSGANFVVTAAGMIRTGTPFEEEGAATRLFLLG